jgi:tetratricopeptide (TPR) repeat protein
LSASVVDAHVEARITTAGRALDADDLSTAIALIDALRADPETRSDARVEELFTRAEARRRETVAALRRDARRLAAADSDVEAVARWSRLLIWEPGDTEASAELDRVQDQLDTLETDRSHQEEELALLSLLVRALQAYGAEEFVLSESLVDTLLTKDPESLTALELKRRLERRTAPPAATVTEQARQLYIAGMRHFNAGRYSEAIVAWGEILVVDPDNDSVRRNIDEARARLGLEGLSE